MCHYITAVLPRSADHGELDAIARKHGRQFKPISNPGIEAQIGADEQYFMTTVGHCDCGTPLGALARGASRTPDWSVQEQRLIRKGWNKLKAARSIAQKKDAFLASAQPSADTNLKDISSWLELIGTALSSGKTSHLGLLLHMYSGSIESRIEIAGREVVRSKDLTGEILGNMREDVLYLFQP